MFEQTGDEFFDLRINQRFATTDGNHRRITFNCGLEALFQRHHVLERRGVFADASAAGAGQVAGVQRFELQDHRELGRLAQFVLDDVAGNFFRQREWESHRFYRAKANCLGVSTGNADGAALGGPAFMSPGRKKVAGETDAPVLMPLQPTLDNATAARTANNMKFQFNFTVASIN